MDKKQIRRHLRRTFFPMGWAMTAYYVLMNVCVLGMMLVDELVRNVSVEHLQDNAWGYLLAAAVAIALIIIWKGKDFWNERIWAQGRKMSVKTFLSLLSLCIGAQLIVTVLAPIVESILNAFGYSALESLENATASADSLSMFLYLSIGAPITEEIVCRGLIQRTLEPYGKRFAIFGSAFLFGLLHGNILQSPYAFAVGLVLGYTACEYSIAWAMLLHMINNLVLGDMLGRIAQILSLTVIEEAIVTYAIIGICAVASIVILIRKRSNIALFKRSNPIEGRCMVSFFVNPGVIVLTIMMLANMLLGITPC